MGYFAFGLLFGIPAFICLVIGFFLFQMVKRKKGRTDYVLISIATILTLFVLAMGADLAIIGITFTEEGERHHHTYPFAGWILVGGSLITLLRWYVPMIRSSMQQSSSDGENGIENAEFRSVLAGLGLNATRLRVVLPGARVISCPQCGQRVKSLKKRCQYCGAVLSIPNSCTDTGDELYDEKEPCIYCEQCGAENTFDSSFCMNCGTSLRSSSLNPKIPENGA